MAKHILKDSVREGDENHREERVKLMVALREQISVHFGSLDLHTVNGTNGCRPFDKESIRRAHGQHREEFLTRELRGLTRDRVFHLLSNFAVGEEVRPERINPELVSVKSDSESGFLFRLATTLWSIPVSQGYGRRMRFLVIDRSNDKLIGIFALMDPVFNLKVRDDWIGWTVQQRKYRLASVMDAYILGAVPPYAQLLGGKLIATLIGSAEVADAFQRKYADTEGIISRERKRSQLSLVTVTSALGRSSIYNRLKLPGFIELIKIGDTGGWGHFHITNEIFLKMRELLEIEGHHYANGHGFGDGPNWRLRVIRQTLKVIGMNEDLLHHGIPREVYGIPMAENWKEYLKCETDKCVLRRPSALEIAGAALERWVIPRAKRRPDYTSWTMEDTLARFEPLLARGRT
jgi:hypothetical protein